MPDGEQVPLKAKRLYNLKKLKQVPLRLQLVVGCLLNASIVDASTAAGMLFQNRMVDGKNDC
jgi:hypothetical protein